MTESDTSTSDHPKELSGTGLTGRLTVALETSSRSGSVAVGIGDEVLLEHIFSGPMQHATELVPALAQLTTKLGWQPADIGDVIVSIGPGSFTGVRISVMVARTLAQAVGCRLIAVPTTEVLALNAPDESPEPIGVILDARRGMIFAATYRRKPPADSDAKPNGQTLLQTILPPTLADPAEIFRRWPPSIRLIGEGIAYHRDAIMSAGLADRILAPETAIPRAKNLYRLGCERIQKGEFTARENLLPLYLRRPEAEELWEKRHGEGAALKN